MDDKSGQDKDNSMEAILLTTQLKEEVVLDHNAVLTSETWKLS